MIYILDHYYAINHEDVCFAVKTNKSLWDIIELTSAITFYFEDIVDVGESLDHDCLKTILCTYYGMEDVTDQYREKFSEIVKKITWKEIYTSVGNVIHIDLYEAREACCGHSYKNIISKWISEGENKKAIEKLLLEIGTI